SFLPSTKLLLTPNQSPLLTKKHQIRDAHRAPPTTTPASQPPSPPSSNQQSRQPLVKEEKKVKPKEKKADQILSLPEKDKRCFSLALQINAAAATDPAPPPPAVDSAAQAAEGMAPAADNQMHG
ncbi:hypothetical protein D5086_021600, partial [Populus alba]